MPWGTFLASLQAKQEPSSEDITENWAGTVFWNDVWEKSIEAEADEAKKRKQKFLQTEAEEARKQQQVPWDATNASDANAPAAAVAPAAGNKRRHI